MADSGEELSRQDIDAVAGKMQAWSENLSDQEQLVIGWILARAMTADNAEVSGYLGGPALGASSSFTSQLALAAGFGLQGTNTQVEAVRLQSHGLAFGRLGRQ